MKTCRIESKTPLNFKYLSQNALECFLYCGEPASTVVTLNADGATVNICVCDQCSRMDPNDMINTLFANSFYKRAAA